MRSPQQLRDDKKNTQRLFDNQPMFLYVKDYLRRLMGKDFKLKILQKYVFQAAEINNLKVDRCARRKFDVLICWCAENWSNINSTLIGKITGNYSMPVEISNYQNTIQLQEESEPEFDLFDNFFD